MKTVLFTMVTSVFIFSCPLHGQELTVGAKVTNQVLQIWWDTSCGANSLSLTNVDSNDENNHYLWES